jgi:hypothetical protein
MQIEKEQAIKNAKLLEIEIEKEKQEKIKSR